MKYQFSFDKIRESPLLDGCSALCKNPQTNEAKNLKHDLEFRKHCLSPEDRFGMQTVPRT